MLLYRSYLGSPSCLYLTCNGKLKAALVRAIATWWTLNLVLLNTIVNPVSNRRKSWN
jgi:hypothetical protein